ncbi:BglG family transcription antiterminator [Clostridium sp. SYSU_GA19001]|uniref:BglG family transcription antiterminator n=1 Tax=Clostridium caldaquaticum TaxID=2940653 RepID=UPI002077090E|nr:PRD domain-containing protein [Clostridium caldaquaticum]MCM8712022.1 BglG family transcription antiterminator [Clostridium caldaquaticum]
MNKIKVTLRQKEIIKIICSEYSYITISSIAEKLGISSRTVLRELGDIEGLLKTYDLSLDKKSGMGIKLNGSSENRKRILESLEEGSQIKNYSSKERQVIILGELLKEKEPIKLFTFTKTLNVTEGTVSHDLDKVEQWLQAYNLKLVRKPGVGVYINGQEEEFRKAIVNLIYENINEVELLDLIRENLSMHLDTRERLLNLIDKDTIRKLESLIFEVEENLNYRLADNAYVGLLVHLALAIERIKKNEKISMDKLYLQELKKYAEFKAAKGLSMKISKEFNIEIPEDEIGYITMHLRGSKGFESRNKSYELETLAKEMIKIAEIETGSFLEHNEQSIAWLINHLGPAINRLKMKMDIRNPLLKEIMEHYPELFKLAEKCVVPVERQIGIKMPDSEIAYIAMHLGAALEKKKSKKRAYKVAIACATGIGTSGLLAAKIEKEYENIQVIDVISSLNINEDMLKDKGIDFIISTVPIEAANLPVVIVNPLFFKKDKELVDNLVKQLKDKPAASFKIQKDSIDLKDKLLRLSIYTEGILQILDNVFIYDYQEFNNIEELIREVSLRLGDEKNSADQIEKSLKAREEIGSTILTGLNAMLLHCKTSGVNGLIFGAVRIKNNLFVLNAEDEKEQIKLAIVMLAPENCNKMQMEIMGFISTKLVEEPDFIIDLNEGTEKDVYLRLNNFLDEFYKMKLN